MDCCQTQFSYVANLLKHCKTHIRYGFKIQYPLQNCTKKYENVSSFLSHILRCHNQQVDFENNVEILLEADSTSIDTVHPDFSNDDSIHGQFSKSDDIGFDAETYRADSFLKQMVLFCVSMKGQHSFQLPLSISLLLK